MRTWLATAAFQGRCLATSFLKKTLALAALLTVGAVSALAQPASEAGGEASLKLPDLSSVSFLNGAIDGHRLLLIGILFCIFGLGFGMVIYMRLKDLPVHRSMREISELIYETCKTYLVTQGKFILLLWVFIAVIILLYFGRARTHGSRSGRDHPGFQSGRYRGQLRRRLVRHSRKYLRQLADCIRLTARQAVPRLPDSARSRHEHRHDADQR